MSLIGIRNSKILMFCCHSERSEEPNAFAQATMRGLTGVCKRFYGYPLNPSLKQKYYQDNPEVTS